VKRFLILSAVVPVTALVIAGCGSSSNSGSSGSSNASATAKPASGSAATISLRTTSLGKVLVDSSGRTLYLFEKDKGPKTTCFGACASAWPPVMTTGKPTAGAGVTAAKLTTTQGSGGKQVVYAGHPLYTYVGDGAPGQTNGEALDQFGAEWYVLNATGHKVEEGGS
jgi:predicted lipoprotein with Yx(FWY)xxD motif